MDQNRRSPVAEATIMPTVPSQPTHCKIKLHYVDVSMAIVSSELRTLVPSTVIEKDYTVEKIREREIEREEERERKKERKKEREEEREKERKKERES